MLAVVVLPLRYRYEMAKRACQAGFSETRMMLEESCTGIVYGTCVFARDSAPLV